MKRKRNISPENITAAQNEQTQNEIFPRRIRKYCDSINAMNAVTATTKQLIFITNVPSQALLKIVEMYKYVSNYVRADVDGCRSLVLSYVFIKRSSFICVYWSLERLNSRRCRILSHIPHENNFSYLFSWISTVTRVFKLMKCLMFTDTDTKTDNTVCTSKERRFFLLLIYWHQMNDHKYMSSLNRWLRHPWEPYGTILIQCRCVPDS